MKLTKEVFRVQGVYFLFAALKLVDPPVQFTRTGPFRFQKGIFCFQEGLLVLEVFALGTFQGLL